MRYSWFSQQSIPAIIALHAINCDLPLLISNLLLNPDRNRVISQAGISYKILKEYLFNNLNIPSDTASLHQCGKRYSGIWEPPLAPSIREKR